MGLMCRNIVEVLGPESDVARFVAYVEQEDDEQEGSLTYIAECGLLRRAPGRARYELVTKWTPPLDLLAKISRQFPLLTLQVEWEQPADELFGCAVIVDGNRNAIELNDLVRNARNGLREVFQQRFQDDWDDQSGCEAELVLGWDILKEASRLHCGVHLDEHDGEEDDGWTEVRQFARDVVREWSEANVV